MKNILKVLFGLLTFLVAVNPTWAKESDFAPEEIIVKFAPGASISQIGKINQKFGAEIKEKLFLPSIFVLKVPAGQEKFLAKLFSSFPVVEFAEPNYEVEALFIPNDPNFSLQWGLPKIQAPEAWEIANGSSSVKIAVLDTGIDADHPDLSSRVDIWKNFSSSRSTDDLSGHGTHVAGIIAAVSNNNLGVAGLDFNSRLLSVKVLNDSGSGYYSWVINGLTWAADNGAKVINLSLGGSSVSTALEEAINYAWNKGAVLACAAGNNGSTSFLYPAYYQNCLAVAATDKNDQKTSWSNYGNWVDVASPGLDIFSTLPNHRARITRTRNYGSLSGTSMATPFVSGLAGLLFGKEQSAVNSEIRNIIEEQAEKIAGTGTYWSKGRINAYKAVSFSSAQIISLVPTQEPTITPTPTSTPTIIMEPSPTLTPTPTLTLTPTPIPSSSPTPTPVPWWCLRWPSLCQ